DQRGCPTAAADVATALAVIATAVERGRAQWGTFHFTGTGSTSWHGFAEQIIETATRFGAWSAGSRPRVEAITTAKYPTSARRPMNSILDCGRIVTAFGISAPRWQESLTAVVQEVLDQNREASASIR